MKTGKSYWAISFRNESTRKVTPWQDYQKAQRDLRKEAAQIIGNSMEYKTEKEALAAKAKLPKHLKEWAEVNEQIPVSLGLGWC
jgi:hypothetical protein